MRRIRRAQVVGLLAVLAVVAAACEVALAAGPHDRICSRVCRYPSQGVTLSAPRPSAVRLAAASHLSRASAVIAVLREHRDAGGVLRDAFISRGVRVSLQTVAERYPTVAMIHPYQAWVVENQGPAVFIGGLGSSAPRPGSVCEDVAVYDLQIRAWSELFQSC